MKLFISVMATIAVFSLLIYDWLCICRIFGKEEIVEKVWKQLFTKWEYNEALVFKLIRGNFLYISLIAFMFSSNLLLRIKIFGLILVFTPILTLLTVISNFKKEN